ncbi:MAG: hypothetical protein K9L28_04900 [Synergistales bacterium]|nr:hypothetical protein [Synergistales bacterium]
MGGFSIEHLWQGQTLQGSLHAALKSGSAGKGEASPDFSAALSAEQGMKWGEWIEVDGTSYRRVVPPGGARRGVSFYADREGNLYSKVIVPGAELTRQEAPEWFSAKGIGAPPAQGTPTPTPSVFPQYPQEMQVGEWVDIEDGRYRQVFPPGPRREGIAYFADEGNFFRRAVYPGAQLSAVEPPDWFDPAKVGTPPASGEVQPSPSLDGPASDDVPEAPPGPESGDETTGEAVTELAATLAALSQSLGSMAGSIHTNRSDIAGIVQALFGDRDEA